MKLGIMQPYFFPYIGYYSLIKHTDRFILLDTVQFIRHGWIERNRILKQNGGWQYIRVPLIKKEGRSTLIRDIQINNKENWKDRIIAQLQQYKKTAPYYRKIIELLNDIFQTNFNDIVILNKISLEKVCCYLGINTPIDVFSELDVQLGNISAPDEWALNICKVIDGTDEYWNPSGGQSFFDRSKYDKVGINLKFQLVKITEYNQKRQNFESGLSILDVLMFNSVTEINAMLDNYELI
ncbi:MAG: WbqC family protein [Bacteroidales bacterium]|jgi:hypothetical protein|nr:WbqC family protein [Bacteroidales bacterium]